MDTNRRKVVELNIEDVLPNRFQPRIKFNEEAINELSKSIKEHGVIQPIVVRTIGDKFEIIAGERRYKATCMAGLKTIPAIITDLNDKDSAEVALIENVQRENLTPIEEAISYKKILDMGYITQDALATKLGKNQSTVANKLRLLNLDDDVQEALLNEKISERHARSLLKLTDKKDQQNMLNRIIAERLTVRKADEEIDKILNGTKEELGMENNAIDTNLKTNSIIEEDQTDTMEENKFKFINIPENRETETFKYINNVEPIENIEETKDEDIKPGKFFNILSEEKDAPEELPQNNNPFDFDNMFIKEPQNINNSLVNEINEIENSINNSNTIPPIFSNNMITEKEDEEFLDDMEFIDEEEINNTKIDSKIIEEEKNPETEKIEEPKTSEMDESIEEHYLKLEPQINNFKDVLEEIRGCSNKIEQAGFIIETEEYDLNGTYQVIFKIQNDK